MNDKQKIGCSVHDCRYCDCACDKCTLNEVKICNCGNDKDKENTMCNSYKKRNMY